MLDYLVVGLGLSGLSICEHLEQRDLKFHVFENNSQKSSLVAAGLYNPVVLKRFTLAWNAVSQMEIALPFYQKLEEKLKVKFIHSRNIYRKFYSAEEQNDWFAASDKSGLSEFMSTEILKELNPNIPAKFGFGKVLKTGNIDTDIMLKEYRKYLDQKGQITLSSFNYSELKFSQTEVEYKGLKARKIIFCEGFGLKKNPFFDYLPLNANKGEYITIYSKELKLQEAVKSSVFIIPLGDNLYRVGATYNNQDKTPEPTLEAREYLSEKLSKIITCDFEVVDQVAGIRPATKDRRPFIGAHPEFKNLLCCNGFGSRGVLIAPMISEQLLDFSEDNKSIPEDSDIKRFTKKYYSA